MASINIDNSQLNNIINFKNDKDIELKGRVISVVNHIPYRCILNANSSNESVIEKIKTMGRQKLQPMPSDDNIFRVPPNSNFDPSPISHIDRRRSTVTSLAQTNMWTLSLRKGHSAMYAALDHLKHDYKTLYIGGTGSIATEDGEDVDISDVTDVNRDSLRDLLKSKYNIVPLFIPDELSAGHYEGYSKKVLWPLLHYMMWTDDIDEVKYWDEYLKVNEIFAKEVVKNYQPGDIIWIHDYHLLLVPQMVRDLLPDAPVGIFIHTPFPSSEIFRCLPHRKELLTGILGANLVGFQTYNYARHFASNCTRILGYEYTPSGIVGNGSLIQLGIYPIGIDVERTRDHCHRKGVDVKAKAMRERYANKKIIVGRDKLDPVKGILQKLEAYEKFLDDYPEWRGKVVLIQVSSPGVLDSSSLESKVAEIVGRINNKYGSLEFTPANMYTQQIDRDEYYALLEVADLCLITPTIDGMNTASFEYVVAQEKHHSPLILSEFTGTANSMSAAVIVNPWNFSEVAKAIADCLSMSSEEKLLKYNQLHDFVTSRTAGYWSKSLVKGLLTVPKTKWGSTTPLDVSRLKLEYNNTKNRVLFFDYDGTLVPICKNPEDAVPSKEMTDVLTALCTNPENTVWVVSGRKQNALENWVGNIPNLGLSAEHGCFIREPNKKDWINMLDKVDMSWKDDVRNIFEYYTERTTGSFIEEKKCTLTWHYRLADPKFGAFQAKECQNHLDSNIVGKLPVEVLVGKKNLEVRPTLINKGEIVKRALSQREAPNVDFILCCGDDKTDEDMFRILERADLIGNEAIQFKVYVGTPSTVTLANWRVDSSEAMINILQDLSK